MRIDQQSNNPWMKLESVRDANAFFGAAWAAAQRNPKAAVVGAIIGAALFPVMVEAAAGGAVWIGVTSVIGAVFAGSATAGVVDLMDGPAPPRP